MGQVILVTGGSRSGKSRHAEAVGESLPGPRAYIATCPVIDSEMEERIRKHRETRMKADWETIEETVDLAGVIRDAAKYNVLLIDCLTLWINNLMYEAEQTGGGVTEEDITNRCRDVLQSATAHPGTVIFVTNEVGLGIVPDNAIARRYRDLVGTCNQTMAAAADRVTLVTCGMPLDLKNRRHDEPA